MTTRQKKPGYCECCAIRYEDLQMVCNTSLNVLRVNRVLQDQVVVRLIWILKLVMSVPID